jgi:regulator of RNase E activity RraA
MHFATFCRFVTPVLAHGRFQIKGFNEPVTMSGQVEERVVVRPGDFVLADDDGIVIVPKALLQEALGYAEAAREAEGEIRKAICVMVGRQPDDLYHRPQFPGRSRFLTRPQPGWLWRRDRCEAA